MLSHLRYSVFKFSKILIKMLNSMLDLLYLSCYNYTLTQFNSTQYIYFYMYLLLILSSAVHSLTCDSVAKCVGCQHVLQCFDVTFFIIDGQLRESDFL